MITTIRPTYGRLLEGAPQAIELDLGHLPAAQRWYQESCAALQPPAVGGAPGPPAALVGLGRVALGQGRPAEAREYLRQALAAQHRNAATTAEAIVYTAKALLCEGELAWPAELCGFLLSWPATPYHVKGVAENIYADLAIQLPAEDLADALRRGKMRPQTEVVAQTVGQR